MTDAKFPKTAFRLSGRGIVAIASGMRVLLYYAGTVELEHSSPVLYEKIRELAGYLIPIARKPAKTHRLRLDLADIAIVMFCLRSLRHEVKRGAIRSLFWPRSLSFPGLMRKLEKYRKRSKRLLEKNDQKRYEQWRCSWHEFLSARRKKRLPPREGNFYKGRLDTICKVVKDVLRANRKPVPDDRQLRQLVRQLVRRVRQGRTTASIPDLLSANSKAKDLILAYLPQKISKA